MASASSTPASAASDPPPLEVPPWLKSLPLAPEYHPTPAEFQNPIAYILKIEKEASAFGICKIVPPLPAAPKKTAVANLNRSFAARDPSPKKPPTFTTRQQQIGFCPRRPRPVQKPVWQSGEHYTLHQFEAKARQFERSHLKRAVPAKKGGSLAATAALSPLEIETLFWRASADKPFSVEYANDMPGSGFAPLGAGKRWREEEAANVGETAWNMRGVSRAKGSLLRFMKEEIPGVTSPMVYVAMMFSWFAWHVEDHELHSLNYLHMGAGKTWYGVPRDGGLAFEEVVRVHGYGAEVNPLVTFAILGEKTTVMSPEVLVGAGIPCCRLVQNAGEFVVTFPGAYHSGFSLGFNCGEAANIATAGWLNFAKEAAIRRASINYPPMVSHFQLLYALALSLHTRAPTVGGSEPRSSRLKDKMKGEGEEMIKKAFVQNVIQNNQFLSLLLDKGSSCIILPQNAPENPICSNSLIRNQIRLKPRLSLGLCSQQEALEASGVLPFNDIVPGWSPGVRDFKGFFSFTGNSKPSASYEKVTPVGTCSRTGSADICSSSSDSQNAESEKEGTLQGDGLLDHGLLSCVTCGILSFSCVAVIQPRETTAEYVMSADYGFLNDHVLGLKEASNINIKTSGDSLLCNGVQVERNIADGNLVRCSTYSVPASDQSIEMSSNITCPKGFSALDLLASAYGDSSDVEEDGLHERSACIDKHDLEPTCSNENDVKLSPLLCNENPQQGSAVKLLTMNSSELPDDETYMHSCGADNQNDMFARNSLSGDGPDVSILNVENHIHNQPKKKRFSGRHDLEEDLEMSHIRMGNATSAVHTELTIDRELIGEIASSTQLPRRSDKDSSRMHVFCLEHAAEVQKQLQPIGGVHMMLLCHPDYPKIEAEAKLFGKELGIAYIWKNVQFREANTEDQERIRHALEDEEVIPMNSDWTVKLGINMYYTASLSKSPLYSKQMPYNSVIYKAFGRSSPGNSLIKQKTSGRKPGRQKKIVVAGRWCGKVWMSNQVHPYLVLKNEQQEQEVEKLFDSYNNDRPLSEMDADHENEIAPSKISSSGNSLKSMKISGKKRKKPLIKESSKRPKNSEVVTNAKAGDITGDSVSASRRVLRSSHKHKEGSKQPKLNLKDEKGGPSRRLSKQLKLDSRDEKAGPSTRLRKQSSKSEELKSKFVINKQSKKRNNKNQPTSATIKDEEKEYICDIDGCSMSFSTKQDLALHKRDICPVKGCGKKFFSHKYLVQHRKVHMDERPLVCPWKGCKMTFKWAWARTEHIRVHTGDRPYICREPGCGQTFRFVSDFSRHKRKTGHSVKKGRR